MRLLIILLLYSSIIFAEQTQLSELLASFNTMSADFTQQVIDANGHRLQQQQGTMQIKKPNLFRWQTFELLVVSDGDNVWHYDQELQQVIKSKFQQGFENAGVVKLLFGDFSVLQTDFTISQGEKACYKRAEKCFMLLPKNRDQSFSKVQLGFTGDKIAFLQLYDYLGQVSEFTFSNVVTEVKFNQDQFRFTIPAGVDVISN